MPATTSGSTPTRPAVLYIHVLGLSDPAAIREDVRRLEQLVVSAITPLPVGDAPGAAPADVEEGSR